MLLLAFTYTVYLKLEKINYLSLKKKIKIKPLTKLEKKRILIIFSIIILFFVLKHYYSEGYFSKSKYFSCEVGFVKKKDGRFDGGPKVMVFKFNLKTKFPKAYVYKPTYGTGYTLSYGVYDVEKKDYQLKLKLSLPVYSTTLYFEGYSSIGQIIDDLTINRTNLKIEYIKLIDGGQRNYSINTNRKIEYGSCKEQSEPTNRI